MKRILAVLLCLLSAYGMMAQERKLQHRPYIDQRRFHYGFLFGVHMQDPVSHTHPRAHETVLELVCRLLLEKKKKSRATYAIRR